jgi:putative hydrolase of the HAD superfamily
MIKAVIFDLDDTLISEMDYIRSGYNHISKILSNEHDLIAKEVYNQLFLEFNLDKKNVFNRVLDRFSVSYDKEYIYKLVNEYREHKPNINFFEDVLPTIKMLKENGLKVGIITDGYKVAQRLKLEAVNAFELFDNNLIITDELGREFWKPHMRPYELIKEKLDVDFNEMVYVGDNPEKDFYIGSIYPITTIRIKRENGIYLNAKYFQNCTSHHIIKDLSELRTIILAAHYRNSHGFNSVDCNDKGY